MSIGTYAVIMNESVVDVIIWNSDTDTSTWDSSADSRYPNSIIVGVSSYSHPVGIGMTFKDNQFIFDSPDEISVSEGYVIIRSRRDNKLISSDWTQGADVPVGIKTAWQPYRQALRDIPTNVTDSTVVGIATDPSHSIWPTPPS